VSAHRRPLVSLAHASFQALFLHQANDQLAADGLPPLDEVILDPRAAVVPPASDERRVHEGLGAAVLLCSCRFRSRAPGVEPTRRHAERATERAQRIGGSLRVDRREDCCWYLAKRADVLFLGCRAPCGARDFPARAASAPPALSHQPALAFRALGLGLLDSEAERGRTSYPPFGGVHAIGSGTVVRP
jgi:hypothetical protein